ncbi:Molybdenum cofactor sulfurase [Acipenser ruthenus]|uniref:Molybdenum cofactor sulfurase n=1 Tax=Acipenser ruthenus TaxID=7906 RepID=A0A662YRB7_ACIRT|nr:Molybdenum cofactor sulfurase [Acipenser ruthenus]
MKNIRLHTFGLARYTYMILSTLQHANGKPVARIYSDTEFCDPSTQGAIINFNVLDNNGDIIGYSQVDKLASLYNIQVRTGCFCNTGACQHHLGLSNEEVKRNLQAGHVCGDNIDIIEGRPTGSVRVSFGYMSTFEDTQTFLKFIIDSFVRAPARLDECRLARLRESAAAETTEPPIPQSGQLGPEPNLEDQDPIHGADLKKPDFDSVTNGHFDAGIQSMKSIDVAGTLTNIFLYPIKSCAAFEDHSPFQAVSLITLPQVKHWPIGSKGLLYDRTWMVVNLNNVCLTQKQEPRLCLIQPQIDLERNTLTIGAEGMSTVTIPVESGGGEQQTRTLCQSKVCGDRNDASTLHFNTEQLIGRFRANLVVCGTQPFEEDGWTELKIGHTSFQVMGQCGRCQMIGIDQDTGTRSKEPLQTLSACRQGKVRAVKAQLVLLILL